MSTHESDIDAQRLSTIFIKLEHDSDDDLIEEFSSKKDDQSNLSSTANMTTRAFVSAYKGKIEVTSKGRRKIFDGVRWQILCRRPDCRKQTNKKSLCITHYKEEYETNSGLSSWSSDVSAFPKAQSSHKRRRRSTSENQNDTISTSNMIDTDEQYSVKSSPHSSIKEGQVKLMHNGRRFILKNSKWQPLCKYDSICRSMAKYELLCMKHFEITKQKRRNPSKFDYKSYRRARMLLENTQYRQNGMKKAMKTNADFQISSSSVTDQFDINSREHSLMASEHAGTNISSKTSKYPGFELIIASKNTRSNSSENRQLEMQPKKLNGMKQNEQSVQTDLTIPLCCMIHRDDHSLFSSCIYDNSSSSLISYAAKHEPQCFQTR